MQPQTLLFIKKELRKLSNIYEVLVKSWNGQVINGKGSTFPITLVISVLISNMAHQSQDTHSYSHKAEVRKLYEDLETLRLLNVYNQECYMSHFPYLEAFYIIDGNSRSEDTTN